MKEAIHAIVGLAVLMLLLIVFIGSVGAPSLTCDLLWVLMTGIGMLAIQQAREEEGRSR